MCFLKKKSIEFVISSEIIKELGSLSSAISKDDLVKNILEFCYIKLNSDITIFYEFDNNSKEFLLPPSIFAKDLFYENQLYIRGPLHNKSILVKQIGQREITFLECDSELIKRQNNINPNNFFKREKILKSIIIPICSEYYYAGLLFINYRNEQFFSDEFKNLISYCRDYFFNLYQKQIIVDKSKSTSIELDLLRNISSKIRYFGNTEIENFFNYVYEQVESYFLVKNFYIALVDKENDRLRFIFGIRDGTKFTDKLIRNNFRGLSEYVVTSEEPLLISSDIEKFIKNNNLASGSSKAKSFLGVPLITGGEIIGMMGTYSNDEEGYFLENHVRTFYSIASQVALAIQNKRSNLIYGELINNFPEATIALDTHENIVDLNIKFCDLLNKDKSELLGRNISDLFWNSYSDLSRLIGRIENNDMSTVEKIFLKDINGERFPTAISATYITDNFDIRIGEILVIKDLRLSSNQGTTKEFLESILRLNRITNKKKLFNEILSTVKKLINCDICYIYSDDKENEKELITQNNIPIYKNDLSTFSYLKKIRSELNPYVYISEIQSNPLIKPISIDSKSILIILLETDNVGDFYLCLENYDTDSFIIEKYLFNLISLQFGAFVNRFLLNEKQKIISEELRESEVKANSAIIASGINHDIRDSISIIVGATESILKELERKTIYRDEIVIQLKKILEETKIQEDLADRLKNASKLINQNARILISINQIIKEALSRLTILAERKDIVVISELDTALDNKDNFIFVSQQEILSVIYNILKNASEAYEMGGTVIISSDIDIKQNQYVEVKIRDFGKGIPDDVKDVLLKKAFYSTKGENGTGLGLYKSNKIIKDFGGYIKFESEMNKGTTFFIYIPIYGRKEKPNGESTSS